MALPEQITVRHLQSIAEEVMNLRGQYGQEQTIFEFLRPPAQNIYDALNKRLGELLQGIQGYHSLELAMYLRTCYNINTQLSHWAPLLQRSIEQSRMRGDRTEDIFYGLMPRSEVKFTNK